MGASFHGEGWGGDHIVAGPPVLRRVPHLDTPPVHSPPLPRSLSMSPPAPRANLPQRAVVTCNPPLLLVTVPPCYKTSTNPLLRHWIR